MPDEDKTFSGSLVLDLRIWWRHVTTINLGKEFLRISPIRKIAVGDLNVK